MTETWGSDEIRAYWRDQASAFGESSDASWSDVQAMELEVHAIGERLPATGRVLDVGCANGWSTLRFAADKALDIRGVDYIGGMIEAAEKHLAEVSGLLQGRAEFAVGNALALEEADAAFDVVISTRVVINLGEWETQLQGLRECVRVLKPGGRFLLSEATLQGWQRLNALRDEWGLPEIRIPSFNNYLDEDRVVGALEDKCDLEELVNFASTYFVGTRVLKPLLAQATTSPIDVADPTSEWNRWFAALPAAGDYGTQKLFVFRKR